MVALNMNQMMLHFPFKQNSPFLGLTPQSLNIYTIFHSTMVDISSVSCGPSPDHAGIGFSFNFKTDHCLIWGYSGRNLENHLTVLRWLERVKGGTWYKKYAIFTDKELGIIWNIADENVRSMLRWGRTLSKELPNVIKCNVEYERFQDRLIY